MGQGSGGLEFAQFAEDAEGFGGVEEGHGEADVDEDEVADFGVGEIGEGDFLEGAVEIDGGAAFETGMAGDGDDATGDGEAHGSGAGVGMEAGGAVALGRGDEGDADGESDFEVAVEEDFDPMGSGFVEFEVHEEFDVGGGGFGIGEVDGDFAAFCDDGFHVGA